MEIPIFPLPMVFFPRVIVPLYIFEERYKLLMNRCIEESKSFGIVLVHEQSRQETESSIHRVGVMARIVNLERLDDGRMNTLNAIETRFRIHRFTGKKPYWTADVEFLDDDAESGEDLQEAYEEVVRLLGDVAELSTGIKSAEKKEVAVPESPVSLSYLVSYALDIDTIAKQALLEMNSTTGRLKSLVVHLNETAERLKKQPIQKSVARKVRSNAHFN